MYQYEYMLEYKNMIVLFKESLHLCQKLWKLLLITIIIHIIFQLDPGLGEINFGIVLLLGIPMILWLIYDFSLTKFIYDQKSKKDLDIKQVGNSYIKVVPKLFFPVLGLTIIMGIIMATVAAFTYGTLSMLNIQNDKSLFESGITDPNFLLFYLLFNLATAFLAFQPPLYFVKNESFFRALINSINHAKIHLPFTLLVGVGYFLFMLIATLIGSDVWYKNVISGSLLGIQYFFFAVFVLLYYLKHPEKTSLDK